MNAMWPLFLFSAIIVAAGAAGSIPRPDTFLRRTALPLIIAAGALVTLAFLFSARFTPEMTAGGLWHLPFASFSCGIDSLSLFFLLPLLLLTTCSALYGSRYFSRHPAPRTHWFHYGCLIAGMALVLSARNGIFFILAWELMSAASFFLVISDSDNPDSIKAGWVYFVSAHIGTAFLLALFFLLSSLAGSFEFASWKNIELTSRQASAAFLLAVAAFGLKAGFIPFHIWLPLAHPAAPSHVSAMMSGVMIKMGIYGILRILTFIAPYQLWWGVLLIGIGAISGIMGVLFAIGQHEIKKLLAFHSVENIGIILLGIGLGVAGTCFHNGPVAFLGFAGGLLHVLNHSLFKGLLFLGAGAVIRQTGTGEIDRLGGLMKKMPSTAIFFMIGATAISGLPFFNGFVSEILIYTGSIQGAVLSSDIVCAMLSSFVIFSLALIGGLAAACFAKVTGIVFLGEPRSDGARNGTGDVPAAMLASMGVLAFFCAAIGMASPFIAPLLEGPVVLLTGSAIAADQSVMVATMKTTSFILSGTLCVTALVAGCRMFKSRKPGNSARTGTWDCGYAAPDPSMQYSASSFASPAVEYFGKPLAAHKHVSISREYFPSVDWSFHSGVEDWFLSRVYSPLLRGCERLFASLHWFQNGKTGQYILYIALTVVCLLTWKFFL